MKTAGGFVLLLALTLYGSGCDKPDLGDPPSLIRQAHLVAVRSEPPEAKPGEMVHYDFLLATPAGTSSTQAAYWDPCLIPKPPAEGNSVSVGCAAAEPANTPALTFDSSVAADACTLFGPLTPPARPGEPPFRPRDPDSSGGFYLPIRARIGREELGKNDGEDLLGFAFERITCNLGNAPADITQEFNRRYLPNTNPRIAGLTAQVGGGAVEPVVSGEVGPSFAAGQTITFEVSATAESREIYPFFDPTQRRLVDRTEAMRVSWFATAGKWEHDRTGRAESDPQLSTANRWTAPRITVSTQVFLWVVLRDSRGGGDFAAYEIGIKP